MKALMMKDLYNIASHSRSTLIVFLLLAVCLLPSTGAMGYMFMLAIMCSSMNLSTFAYDEASHWNAYALTLPVSRKDVVLAKFATLCVFTLIGVLVGLVVGAVGEILMNGTALNGKFLAEMAASACMAFWLGMTMGGTSLPLVFRFGAEKVRMFTFLSAALPAGVLGLGYLLLDALGVTLSEAAVYGLMVLSPLLALAWDALMAWISLRIFRKQDVK